MGKVIGYVNANVAIQKSLDQIHLIRLANKKQSVVVVIIIVKRNNKAWMI